ncbi:MAG: DUF4956 domain-containing protein [Melioribacteraceae bacterium]|nr:DUF4956 domain-containing protein [Melioribacteraceae bacterium]
MFSDFQQVFNFSLSLGDMLANIVVSFICGVIISLFYRWSYKGPGYSISFLNSIVVLSMITSVVIMVIGNNLARAFGLVGAMSIIRFRTAVKDTIDIVFIFFSLSIGMAAGVGLKVMALSSTMFIGLILLFLTNVNIMAPSRKEFLLQFFVNNEDNETESFYSKIISKFCKNVNLINVKTMGDGSRLELSYHVALRNEKKNGEFIRELNKINGVENISFFYDEEHF